MYQINARHVMIVQISYIKRKTLCLQCTTACKNLYIYNNIIPTLYNLVVRSWATLKGGSSAQL